MQAYLASPEGWQKYADAYPTLLAYHRLTEPHRPQQAAHEATVAGIKRLDFRFPEYAAWGSNDANAVWAPGQPADSQGG